MLSGQCHLIVLCNLAELIRNLYLQKVLPPFRQIFVNFCDIPYVPCQHAGFSELESQKLSPQCHFKYISCTGLLSAFLWLCNHRYILYSSVQEMCVYTYMHACTYVYNYYIAHASA